MIAYRRARILWKICYTRQLIFCSLYCCMKSRIFFCSKPSKAWFSWNLSLVQLQCSVLRVFVIQVYWRSSYKAYRQSEKFDERCKWIRLQAYFRSSGVGPSWGWKASGAVCLSICLSICFSVSENPRAGYYVYIRYRILLVSVPQLGLYSVITVGEVLSAQHNLSPWLCQNDMWKVSRSKCLDLECMMP